MGGRPLNWEAYLSRRDRMTNLSGKKTIRSGRPATSGAGHRSRSEKEWISQRGEGGENRRNKKDARRGRVTFADGREKVRVA